MKNFALNHPFITGFVVFFLVLICGTFAGFILGILLTGDCRPRSASDPCDAGVMLAAAIWSLSLVASLIAGILAGISSAMVLRLKQKP